MPTKIIYKIIYKKVLTSIIKAFNILKRYATKDIKTFILNRKIIYKIIYKKVLTRFIKTFIIRKR